MATPKDIAELLIRQANGTLSSSEKEVLEAWMHLSASHRLFQEEMNDNKQLWKDIAELSPANLQASEAKVLSGITSQIWPVRTAHRVHFLRTAWFRVAVAILIIAGVGAYLWNQSNNPGKSNPLITQNPEIPVDVMPGGNKAILVLGDESVINLDSAADGQLARQGASDIIKLADGEIIYNPAGKTGGEIFYQKLITPAGGQYMITLADGSQAWLNAMSSIRFPSVFTGNTREVEITGEVYLEVKANKLQPFIVKTNNEKVEVLGTAFNIKAYPGEAVKTSLLSGSVKINNHILQPGQALVNNTIITTNINQDVAWKNGRFDFDEVNIKEAMRQLERWYDIKVAYQGNNKDIKLVGGMKRELPLSEVLKLLQTVGINCRLNNRTLTVIL